MGRCSKTIQRIATIRLKLPMYIEVIKRMSLLLKQAKVRLEYQYINLQMCTFKSFEVPIRESLNFVQFRPPIALRTDLSHITTELWEISVLRMAH